MHAVDLSRQPYRRPPLSRATDPQRMNWLWRLLCEVADVSSADVVDALHASQIPIDQTRARSWVVSDRDDAFFPISIAEVERNLRAVLQLRKTIRENSELAGIDDGEGEPVPNMTDGKHKDVDGESAASATPEAHVTGAEENSSRGVSDAA